MIYLDHQSTTPVDPSVLAEMTPYFLESFGNPHSTEHYLGWESMRAVEDAATHLARLIGADVDEIIFTSGATESNNLALLGLAKRGYGDRKRHRILISAIEHKCIHAICRILNEQHNYSIEQIPVDDVGFVDLSALENSLDDDVLLVSIMAVNNEIGTIQDVEKLSELIRHHGGIFHCDAAQAPLGMNMMHITEHVDMLSLSAHKMYGPKGVGIIYVSRDLQSNIEPLIYGGGQQDGLRSGTVPVPLCVGMGAAAKLMMNDKTEEKRAQLRFLRETFIDKLKQLSWPTIINGPGGQDRHAGNANICFVGFSAHDILNVLQPHLAASTGSACSSGIPEPSHVLKAIGLTNEEAESSIRFSLGLSTTQEDIDRAAGLIEEALKRISKLGTNAVRPV